MHELGICSAVLKTIDKVVKEEKLEGVNKVTLELGLLSGVVPHYLTDCWQAVIYGTDYQDTQLVLEIINGIARCEDCGHEFAADLDNLVCPKCGGRKLTPETGTDLTIKEIEAW